MLLCRTIAELRRQVAAERAAGCSIGFVPTMGAFHEGHLELMRAAGRSCDVVVVSLFVNPTQFDRRADLERYPRIETDDARLARSAGVEVLFAPSVQEIYPAGFATSVHVAGLGDVLEGQHRPGHFAAVCTVVAKLLSIVSPDVAVFGQKDAQQLAVIHRMVSDLNLPVRIEAHPTVRENDGLAMSSRNRRLSPDDRRRAVALPRALAAAAAAIERGERDWSDIRNGVFESAGGEVDFEYFEALDPSTFSPVDAFGSNAVLVAAAAHVGDVRLIDNLLAQPTLATEPPAGSESHRYSTSKEDI